MYISGANMSILGPNMTAFVPFFLRVFHTKGIVYPKMVVTQR